MSIKTRPVPLLTSKQLRNFWSKVDTRGLDDCWLWIASCNSRGYGNLGLGCHTYKAHRVLWTLVYGPIPPELEVLHSCDFPPCCNSEHLFLGTQSDNIWDMSRKGRHWAKQSPHLIPGGSQKSNSKLNEEKVIQIRNRARQGESHNQIARDFGVSGQLINGIVAKKRWTHVQG